MSAIRIEDLGGLGAIAAMVDWRGVNFVVNSRQNIWNKKASMIEKVEAVISGRFFLTIDREDEMTARRAFFIIRCEDDADAQKIAKELGGELRPVPRKPTEAENAALMKMRDEFLAGMGIKDQ